MKQKLVRILFIVAIPILFLQLLFVKEFEEPYPSVRFPGFGHVFSADYPREYVNVSVIVHIANQQQAFTMNELLSPTPQYAKVFFKPMSEKFKNLPDTLVLDRADKLEYDLMEYLKTHALSKTSFDKIDKITLQWNKHIVSKPNVLPTTVPLEAKTLLFN